MAMAQDMASTTVKGQYKSGTTGIATDNGASKVSSKEKQ